MVKVSSVMLNDSNEKLTVKIPLNVLKKFTKRPYKTRGLFLKSLMVQKFTIEYNQNDKLVSSMSNTLSVSNDTTS